MIHISIILLIIISCFLVCLSIRLKNNSQILIKNKELIQLNKQIAQTTQKLFTLKKSQEEEKQKLEEIINKKQQEINRRIKKINEEYQTQFEEISKSMQIAYQQDKDYLNHKYQQEEEQLKNKIKQIQTEKEQIQSKLEQIKSVYKAASAARLRQQEEENKIKFYCINISDKQINDITLLQEWKHKLYDPSIVAKIIWSSYIMKPTSDMCNRVVGSTQTCGIYKITNKKTQEVYIGQSVNITDRFKQHVKCGLGIDASPTNKLYNSMQETGVWNFTFEILQKCTRDKLNEKERFWIEMYQSNKNGLNIMKGNK